MIPVSTLYDESIDRPKLTEQKKTNPFEYIVLSPSAGLLRTFTHRNAGSDDKNGKKHQQNYKFLDNFKNFDIW